jgi:hypothetical protein
MSSAEFIQIGDVIGLLPNSKGSLPKVKPVVVIGVVIDKTLSQKEGQQNLIVRVEGVHDGDNSTKRSFSPNTAIGWGESKTGQ